MQNVSHLISLYCHRSHKRTGPLDDIVNFLITIGSPALAAYSLQITHLNKYWITSALLDIDYPNAGHMASVLSAFHHIPIQIEYRPPFLHSLVVLPDNDKFWSQLAAANSSRRWSIPLVMSYVLVIFSLFLTTADSISNRPGDIGYSIAAIWTFLLPLIIGWLYVGCEPEPSHLRRALAAANREVWVSTEERGHPVTMTCPKAMEFARASGVDAKPDDVDPEADNLDVEAGGVDLARNDELKPVPVFNYSRAFVTPMNADVVLRLLKNAAANAKREIPVGNSVGPGGIPVWVPNDKEGNISHHNRIGTIAEVVEYCSRVLRLPKRNSGYVAQLEIQPADSEVLDTTYPLIDQGLVVPSRWAPGIWTRVVVASILALALQWGTAGAAVYIHYIAPPPGLGCRAFSFLLYGLAGTLSFLLLLASSILAHMSRPLPGQVPTRSWSTTCQNAGATIFRWAGKCVAIVSAIGIVLACFFQVTEAFDNCYCTSTTFDKGRHFVVFTGITFDPDYKLIFLWITGQVVAFVVAILFGCSMYAGLPPRR